MTKHPRVLAIRSEGVSYLRRGIMSLLLDVESLHLRIDCCIPELLLDTKELVVLGYSFAAAT